MRLSNLVVISLATVIPCPAVLSAATFGGGPLSSSPSPDCVPTSQRDAAAKRADAYVAKHGGFKGTRKGSTLAKYSFWPQAGTLDRDLFVTNFVDMDQTSPGILDWNCGQITYDGHQGIDVDIVTWTQKNLGVPIFAALDGLVVETADGNFDQQTVANPDNPANFVILDHGNGQQTWYWHMKNGSVAVRAGDVVKAGQQLGLTASSGSSTGPHLHFESRYANASFESFAGACNQRESNWLAQPVVSDQLYIREFNVTTDDLNAWTGLPNDTTRQGYVLTGVQPVKWWLVMQNLPANSTNHIRFLRPDGSVRYDAGTGTFNGNTVPFRWSYWWWWYNVDFDVTGTWHIEYSINDRVMASAPLQVVASPAANQAPHAATATLLPEVPGPNEPVRCTVGTDLLFRDPDYDQVRYRYVWRVAGQVVRDVTTVAISDMIPGYELPVPTKGASAGKLPVACTVTPTDGLLDGESLTVTSPLERDEWILY